MRAGPSYQEAITSKLSEGNVIETLTGARENFWSKEIPGDRVLKVLTQYQPQQVQADRLLDQGRYAEALALYGSSRGSGS